MKCTTCKETFGEVRKDIDGKFFRTACKCEREQNCHNVKCKRGKVSHAILARDGLEVLRVACNAHGAVLPDEEAEDEAPAVPAPKPKPEPPPNVRPWQYLPLFKYRCTACEPPFYWLASGEWDACPNCGQPGGKEAEQDESIDLLVTHGPLQASITAIGKWPDTALRIRRVIFILD